MNRIFIILSIFFLSDGGMFSQNGEDIVLNVEYMKKMDFREKRELFKDIDKVKNKNEKKRILKIKKI